MRGVGERQRSTSVEIVAVAIFGAALVARLLHNGFIMESPLYAVPLGGHVVYLRLAERIAAGDLFPSAGAMALNDPLYPYILALQYLVVGVGDHQLARLFGVVTDSVTCVMIAMLARRHFGALAGALAGLLAASYGPMIFYATEPMTVVYTLFFVTLGVLVLDRGSGLGSHFLSGLALGLAVDTRPNLLLLAILLLPAPLLLHRRAALLKSGALSVGVTLAVVPLAFATYVASGKLGLPTASGGLNFYLGHRYGAGPGYQLPDTFDDAALFHSMKQVAERAEQRTFSDDEVSAYYRGKAIRHIVTHPLEEGRLAVRKLLVATSDYEASTYVSYYFQQGLSPVLAHAVSFGTLFPLAALGMVLHARRYVLLAPIVSSLVTIVLFFYVARLRMPMVPFLAAFAGAAITRVRVWIQGRAWGRCAGSLLLVIGVATLSNWPRVAIDTSNEWNKVGIVLRVRGEYAQAEAALLRARAENPRNAHSYLNLAVLYDQMGEPRKAAEMRAQGENLRSSADEDEFVRTLRDQ